MKIQRKHDKVSDKVARPENFKIHQNICGAEKQNKRSSTVEYFKTLLYNFASI